MAIFSFAPSSGASVGKTIAVTTGATVVSAAGTLTCTNLLATQILVTNSGTVAAFVRLSSESPPVATTGDVPFAAGASRILVNPVPNGLLGLAVIPASGVAVTVYFTPGIGGT